ncbi:arginase family protein [Bordetella sp. N]|uniref:arginase family protein n=1 Tax=Bordetella sp. N TaxID=1746199 RepID=UPI000ACA23E6|nr:arginase family protein [Bordetella sp. N]
MTLAPLVLDTDGSVGRLPGEVRLAITAKWREAIRFGCARGKLEAFMKDLYERMPAGAELGTVFLGSGDFHHLTWPLVRRCIEQGQHPRLRVVVLDNHPDNMLFPFGVHCGSWVHRVARLPQVEQVHVIGITSGDLGAAHAWEHHLGSLLRGKVTYWSTGVDTRWAKWLGVGKSFRSFPDRESLVQAVSQALADDPLPTYLSIDKDVFATTEVRTNWDQGVLLRFDLHAIVQSLRGQIVASDVTGDVSLWRYRTPWKRILSSADGQHTSRRDPALAEWQRAQNLFNGAILALLQDAG